MKTLGKIQLPITKAQKVMCNTYEETMDFILDLHISEMNKILEAYYKLNKTKLLYYNCKPHNAHVIIIYLPLKVWCDYKDQKFACWISPTIEDFACLFTDMKFESRDIVELSLIQQILSLLTTLLNAKYQPTC